MTPAEQRAHEREELRGLRTDLVQATRDAREECRIYAAVLSKASVRANRPYPDEHDRALDRAYANAMGACNRLRMLQARL